jgi:hypothetical protein
MFRVNSLVSFLKSNNDTGDYKGGGLPLLYPRDDIGYSYSDQNADTNNYNKNKFSNQLYIGSRLPHCWLHVHDPSDSSTKHIVSSVNLSTIYEQAMPIFILIALESVGNAWIKAAQDFNEKNVDSIKLKVLLIREAQFNQSDSCTHAELQKLRQVPSVQSPDKNNPFNIQVKFLNLKEDCIFADDLSFSSISPNSTSVSSTFSLLRALNNVSSSAVVVRPDGYVSATFPSSLESKNPLPPSFVYFQLLEECFSVLRGD